MEEAEPITEKKKAIFNTTLSLIRDHGFHGTTMSLLIKNSGVAAGTIYHYFDSKDSLIIELHAYIRTILANALLESDDQSKSFKERFFTFWNRQWLFYTQNPDALYFIEQFVNSPYYLRCPYYQNDHCQNIITQFVKTGIDAAILKPMNYRIMGIMVHSSVLTAAKIKLKNQLPIGEEEVSQVIEMMWDGIVNKEAPASS
ncbi:TetR/AcrR family transcriptional regulator [Adhaeribacter swui]|uniref:TetR/AcrR family transcriptional regulator n=1 Tax=Adhaeribacter swui TaxID=2086471 RepID=A0A7G7GEW5_9BACT|nr:TetR/AcrR family transcriptional regulator [Adhaeribacter swui]QNF35699.1 TetR/AcrR family transcriptional regulator [Adhaeribacter swui]